MQKICLSLILGLLLVEAAEAARPTKYQITVNVSAGGSVISSAGGISCPGACTTSVNSGTSITFTATPDPGATFAGWGGACAGTSTTCNLTISATTSISATFEDGGGGGGGSAPTISQVTFDLDAGTVTAVGSGMVDVTEVTWGNELAPLTIEGTPSETAVSAVLPTSLFYGDFLLTVTNLAGSAKWQLTFDPDRSEGCPAGFVQIGNAFCIQDSNTTSKTFSECSWHCANSAAHVCRSTEFRAFIRSGETLTDTIFNDWVDSAGLVYFVRYPTDSDNPHDTKNPLDPADCRCCVAIE